MIKIQIVAPALNEGAILPDFIDAFLALKASMASSVSARLIVVDDGSTDDTLTILRAAAAEHPDCISYLSFVGNAGHQAALVAGMLNSGDWPDAIVTMDADLEHPFEVVARLIDKWRRSGAVVVHAIRRESKRLGWTKRWPSALFYHVTARLTGLSLIPGQADFKLWDGHTLRQVAQYLPHIGSLRVFAAWLPGRQESVEYEQQVRGSRQSRFTFHKNYELAIISIVRFSQFPLRAITSIGMLGLSFALVYGVFITIETSRGHTVPGWASTVLTVMTMGCLQLVSIGILASYMRRLVFARDLPLYIVREARLTDSSESRGTGVTAP